MSKPEEELSCTNCGSTRDVRRLSFDMDLPVIQLCLICSFTIVCDRPLFEKMGKHKSTKR